MAKGDDVTIKRMTELLRGGAVMLDLACPLCNAPLFRLKSGEVVCPAHGQVVVVKSDSEAIEAQSQAVLDRLESLAASKMVGILERLAKGIVDDEREALDELERWLEILERVRRLKLATRERK